MEKAALQVEVFGGTRKFGVFCMIIYNRVRESVNFEPLQSYATAGSSNAGSALGYRAHFFSFFSLLVFCDQEDLSLCSSSLTCTCSFLGLQVSLFREDSRVFQYQ